MLECTSETYFKQVGSEQGVSAMPHICAEWNLTRRAEKLSMRLVASEAGI
jgi:hypothetical protein